MSDDDFMSKYGFDVDPVILWDQVLDRIQLDLGWAFSEDYRDYDEGNWLEFHEDIVRGIESTDNFIEDNFGPAAMEFQSYLEEYQLLVDSVADKDLTIDDWLEFKRQIHMGIRKLTEMARNNKLKASGALRNKVEVNTQKWEEMQKSLKSLGKRTRNQLKQVK